MSLDDNDQCWHVSQQHLWKTNQTQTENKAAENKESPKFTLSRYIVSIDRILRETHLDLKSSFSALWQRFPRNVIYSMHAMYVID